MTESKEMEERVARALCVADGLDPDADWRHVGGVMLTVMVANPANWARYENLKRARAAIAALSSPGVEGWRPIETAPKDGTEFLGGRGKDVRVWRWKVYDGFWRDLTGFIPLHGSGAAKPTHWLPLPPGPSMGGKQGVSPCSSEPAAVPQEARPADREGR